MDIRKLQRAIVDGLEDVKAQNIVVFNTEHMSPLFERVIVASGTSNRQTKALAASVRDAVRVAGFPVLATEGADNGEWIIVDCGAAVAHIMQPPIRDYYRLEEIWGGKSVKMKLGAVSTALVKAAEPEPVKPAPQFGAKSAATGKKPVPKRAGPRKPATSGATEGASRPSRGAAAPEAPARKRAVAKSPAKKSAGAGGRSSAKVVTPVNGPRKPAAKPAAKRTASTARPTPARKRAAGRG